MTSLEDSKQYYKIFCHRQSDSFTPKPQDLLLIIFSNIKSFQRSLWHASLPWLQSSFSQQYNSSFCLVLKPRVSEKNYLYCKSLKNTEIWNTWQCLRAITKLYIILYLVSDSFWVASLPHWAPYIWQRSSNKWGSPKANKNSGTGTMLSIGNLQTMFFVPLSQLVYVALETT